MKLLKWIKNYWYYYKVAVFVVIIALLIGAFAIYGMVTKEKFDYNVYLCMSENAPTELVSSIKASVTQYGEDVDKNGEVKVQIINISYDVTDADSSEAQAKAALFAGEMQTGGNFVFIYDSYYYDMTLKNILEAPKDISGLKYNNNTSAKIEDTELDKMIRAGLISVNVDPNAAMPELYIGLRKSPDKAKDNYSTYLNDKALFSNILSNRIIHSAVAE